MLTETFRCIFFQSLQTAIRYRLGQDQPFTNPIHGRYRPIAWDPPNTLRFKDTLQQHSNTDRQVTLMTLLVSPPNDCTYPRLICPKRATCTAHSIVGDLLTLIIQYINSSLLTSNIVYYSEGRRIKASYYFMRADAVSAETKKCRTERTLHNHQCRTESTLHNHH